MCEFLDLVRQLKDSGFFLLELLSESSDWFFVLVIEFFGVLVIFGH